MQNPLICKFLLAPELLHISGFYCIYILNHSFFSLPVGYVSKHNDRLFVHKGHRSNSKYTAAMNRIRNTKYLSRPTNIRYCSLAVDYHSFQVHRLKENIYLIGYVHTWTAMFANEWKQFTAPPCIPPTAQPGENVHSSPIPTRIEKFCK